MPFGKINDFNLIEIFGRDSIRGASSMKRSLRT